MKALRAPLVRALWPLFVVGTALAFQRMFEWGFAPLSLMLVPLVGGILLFALEFVLPDRKGQGTWDDPQLINDLGHGALGQGGGNALGQATFVFGAALLAGEVSARFGANLWPADWSLWIQVPLLIFLADGLDYGRHRLEHTVSWLWPIHALHHDVDRMNVIKSSRGHLLDMLFRNLVCYAPLALIGVPAEVLLSYAAAVTVFGPVAHANVALPVPAMVYRWVLTPQVHRIHHAKPLALSRSNYANVFPIWDVLFGTFTEPEAAPSFEYGVEDSTQPSGFVGQTLAPFADWRAQRAAPRARAPLTEEGLPIGLDTGARREVA